jgi:hypothetical protein
MGFGTDNDFTLETRPQPGRDFTYCILDDGADMLLTQAPYFIRTDAETGLSDADVLRAVEILNQLKVEN